MDSKKVDKWAEWQLKTTPRTFSAWRELGYQVSKGAKAVYRKTNGQYLFSFEQVYLIDPH